MSTHFSDRKITELDSQIA